MVEVAVEGEIRPLDKQLATQALEALHLAYPGYAWMVDVPPGQNVMKVKNLDLCPRGTYGIVFHKSNLSGSNVARTMVRAGGELLERWNVERKGYTDERLAGREMIFEKPET